MKVDSGLRYVAFFDILGFSDWVRTDGSRAVFDYVRGFLRLLIDASLPGARVQEDMSVITTASPIAVVNFSDSIVFYSIDDSRASLEAMLIVCGEFMNSVICGPSRMIRGAIAHGEFYADPEFSAYVGAALIDAYRLEGSQDWLACGIHESVEVRPDFVSMRSVFPKFIVPALAQLKDGAAPRYCINWGDKSVLQASFSTRRGLHDCYKRGLRALGGNTAERNKLKCKVRNTRDFLLHYNGTL